MDFWLRTDDLIAVLRHKFWLRKLPHILWRYLGLFGFGFGLIIQEILPNSKRRVIMATPAHGDSSVQGIARGRLVLYWISLLCAFALNLVMLITVDSSNVRAPRYKTER